MTHSAAQVVVIRARQPYKRVNPNFLHIYNFGLHRNITAYAFAVGQKWCQRRADMGNGAVGWRKRQTPAGIARAARLPTCMRRPSLISDLQVAISINP